LAAGARCTFVFGPTDAETIGRLAAAIKGPLNIGTNVGCAFSPSLDELRRLGVRRASMGGAIMYASYGAARQVLERVQEAGTFEHAAESVSFGEMNRLLEKYPDAPACPMSARRTPSQP
jgi:2-methylisocitrate lyase-like PEP mutase family enzyme